MDLISMQIMSAFLCVLASIILIVSPYKGKGYGVYYTARQLIFAGLIFVAVQFLLQLLFSFRRANPDWGAACNIFFFTPAMLCFDWAILLCARAGNIRRSEYLVGLCVLATVAVFLCFGLLWPGQPALHEMVVLAAVISGLCCMHYFGVMYAEYRRMYKHIQNEFGNPIESFIGWMRWSVLLMFVSTVVLYLGIVLPVGLLPFAFVMWTSVFYFITRFCFYGRYVKAINDLVNDAEVPSDEVADTVCCSVPEKVDKPSATNPEVQDLLSKDKLDRLECWLGRKGFCTKGLTIVELAGLLGTNRTTLSQYINMTKGMPFRDWINHLRCTEAERMMRNRPSLPVEEVAEKCGFSSRNYFDQVFMTYAGVTPATFRQQLQK